jgi:hypothetical protein
LLDVCVDNGVNDITGTPILERNSVVLSMAVTRQQEHLNTLFAGLGIRELLVDGISGPVTRQRLCAARLALGLPVSTDDMAPGSEEEQTLFATTTLPVPFTSSILSPRWVLIDRTCQIMFAGEGTDRLVFVFPTSTGEAGYETRDQDLQPVRRSTRRSTTTAGTTRPPSRWPRTTRSTATCTSRCTSTVGRRSTGRTTCRRRRRARGAPV